MHPTRPVFLDLWKIKLPMSGVVSILHRVSGVVMVVSLPILAILFHLALSGPDGFETASNLLTSPWTKPLLILLVWSLLHHLFAGLRYLLLDLGLGLERGIARRSAWAVVAAALGALVIGGGLAP
jgi:succinate dehydrogenase / fumarate reductase cytochrome b subunit